MVVFKYPTFRLPADAQGFVSPLGSLMILRDKHRRDNSVFLPALLTSPLWGFGMASAT